MTSISENQNSFSRKEINCFEFKNSKDYIKAILNEEIRYLESFKYDLSENSSSSEKIRKELFNNDISEKIELIKNHFELLDVIY